MQNKYLLNVTVNWNLKYGAEVKADTTEIDWNDPNNCQYEESSPEHDSTPTDNC
jgi:hypothetical protein